MLIVEEPSWAEAAENFGGLENVDEALAPIIDALVLNPAGFPQIAGGIRLAKTDRIERDNGSAHCVKYVITQSRYLVVKKSSELL